jgi:hypothetical protein
MTEAEWLACADPEPMLDFLQSSTEASDRKQRLLALACCRRISQVTIDPRLQDAVLTLERYGDGKATWEELDAAFDLAGYAAIDLEALAREAGTGDEDPYTKAGHAVVGACLPEPYRRHKVVLPLMMRLARVAMVDRSGESGAQCRLLRDIFGPLLFRPLPPRPEAIAPLAEEIYAGRWDLMALLGEWLQEHGFWQEGEHCLDPNSQHVKGCWVVDWVTGRQ